MKKTPIYIPPEVFPIRAILEHFKSASFVAINGAINSFSTPCLISEKVSEKLKITAGQINNIGWTFEMYWRPTGNRLLTMIKIIQRPDNLYFVSSIIEGAATYSFPISYEDSFTFYMEGES